MMILIPEYPNYRIIETKNQTLFGYPIHTLTLLFLNKNREFLIQTFYPLK